ncbi:MAG: S9 family peptidase [Ignavibacterium sp.]|nr:S9 family peptidase [Ignavibacterium sp.]MCX7611791.1 S9 family peptidase [Ignavibacterium sp.]MDW8374384.1 S9 family peptidase [Ignavibacteriales bacterium]
MKNLISALLIVLSFSFIGLSQEVQRKELGNLVIENIPEIPQRIKDRMFQYQSTRAASFQDWLHNDKGILISTRFGETNQIHIVEKPGGARKQITFFNEPVSGATFCPDKNKNIFLFTKDIGGGEFYQIYSFDLNNGNFKLLTDGKSSNGGVNWNNKGDKFSYFSTKRNGKDWDIYISDIDGNSEMILSEGGAWTAVDWSPDDKKLLIRKSISANESYYYVYDLTSKKLTQINPSNDKISYGSAVFSKDGKGIFYSSDQNNEFKKLRYYDLSTGKEKILTEKIDWDVESIQLNKKGDKLAFTVNENGLSKLYLMNTKDFSYKQVKSIPTGLIGGLSFNSKGDKLALTINTPTSPSDVFMLDLKNNSLEQWTFSEVGGLNQDNFIVPELFHYETFDSVNGKPRMIPAFIYKPKTKGPHPVVIDIHGGPEAQARPSFNPINQYYALELGIAVIEPNVRGSSGYGKTYLELDNWYNRENSVKDIGKLIEWIEKQPDLDPKRIAVTGGSYGGYMVLASMIHFNDKIRCGVDIVGISNFVTFLNNTQDYRRDLRRVEYGDERIPEMKEFLLKISPTTNAHKITKPLFVVQGLNDPRVPYTEAEQIVQAVRKNGTEVWYLLAKDEGHGFRKKSNRDFYIWSEVLFFEKFLLN